MTPSEFLQKIVSIYSPSGREETLAEFIVATGKELGFVKTEIDRFNNVILEIGSGKKEVVLLGHIDTVKGFLPVKIKDDLLFGRGTVDAKGPFATYFFAALAAAPKLQNTKIIVAGATEEESSGKGARALLDRFHPAAVIIGEPSSWDGITLGFKGLLVVEFYQKKSTAHSANLKKQNVIESGIAFTEKIRLFAEEFNKNKNVFDALHHRIEKFNFEEDGEREKIHIEVKFRTPLNFNFSALKEYITKCCGKAEVNYLHSWGTEEACLAPKNSILTKAFLPAIRAEGGTPRFKVKTGTSDMNTFMKAFPGVPMVSYGPGDSNLDHTPKEHISLTEYEKAIRVLTEVLVRVDQSLGFFKLQFYQGSRLGD